MAGREARDEAAAGRGGSFGALLRDLREGAGLTQEELALRADLSPNAVGALERGARKHPYPHTVRSLADALGLSQDERATLLAAVPRRGATAPNIPLPGFLGSALPSPPTPLVGRERELSEISDILGGSGVRLLTLTGIGGVGKTRLAAEAAREAGSRFPDGAAFVGLAPLSDSALVVPTVLRSLGVPEVQGRTPSEALIEHLRDKGLLLVLDNLEHLLEAAPEVAALIEACPGLVVLATSRAPLRVRGEREYPVPPLALPPSARSPAEEDVAGSPSGRLFLERARAVSPSFEVTAQNAGAVAAICRRLAGLPLALELAAARARILDPATLLARLDQALSTAGTRDLPERQRTMRGTLDWSYELLHAPEKALFRRLSVFAGGWTLEAAEAVGKAGEEVRAGDVLVLLGNLVEQSLVVAEGAADGSVRYGMLEPVRQYGRERLEEGGVAEAVAGRHAAFFLALAEQADPELKGPRQVLWLERLQAEQDNLRAAMRWLLEKGESEEAARLGWALWLFWWIHGRFAEGRRWMEEALEKGTAMPASLRAKALFVAGTMAGGQADLRSAESLLEESLTLFRELGDKRGAAFALGSAAQVAIGQGRHERGVAFFEEGADLFLEVGEKWGAAVMFSFLAVVWRDRGEYGRANRLAERGLALAREMGDRQGTSIALYVLAVLEHASGEHERARGLFEEGLKLSAEVGDETNVAYCLEGLGGVAGAAGELMRAARLWGAAEALLEKIEATAYPYATDRSLYHSQVAAAREQLDEGAWAEAWEEGRMMTLEEAVRYALEGGRSAARE